MEGIYDKNTDKQYAPRQLIQKSHMKNILKEEKKIEYPNLGN